MGNKKCIPLIGNRGFTLVELMVTIALLVMVIFMAGSFINFSFNLEKKSDAEYDFQASMRQASRIINNEIRNSSVTFTMAEEHFKGKKTDKWDYLGVENHKEIVQYKWDPNKWNPTTTTNGAHERIVLVSSNVAISYNLTFNKVPNKTNLVGFTLEGINSEEDSKKHTIYSELIAMNSVAVDDGGSLDNPAVAIAYRSDSVPKPEEVTTKKEVTILIAMVMDQSGSMDDKMDVKEGNKTIKRARIEIMKQNAKNLISGYSENIKVAIIPFANSANNPGDFKACTSKNKTDINKQIDNMEANGGTNTGDGLRRAYHQIKKYNTDNKTEEIVNYIILLTDGNPTYYSSTNKKSYVAKMDGNNLDSDYRLGTGGETPISNIDNSMKYVSDIGQGLVVGGAYNIRTFVIGFTDSVNGVTRGKEIAETACTKAGNPERKGTYHPANSAIQLEQVLTEITTTILQETWHIYGPY